MSERSGGRERILLITEQLTDHLTQTTNNATTTYRQRELYLHHTGDHVKIRYDLASALPILDNINTNKFNRWHSSFNGVVLSVPSYHSVFA